MNSVKSSTPFGILLFEGANGDARHSKTWSDEYPLPEKPDIDAVTAIHEAKVDGLLASLSTVDDVTEERDPIRSKIAAFIAKFKESEALQRERRRREALIFKPAPKSLSEIASGRAHRSSWSEYYGVSHQTVARRYKAGVRKKETLFRATNRLAHVLEFEGNQYSATTFARIFGIGKGVVLRGVRAGMTGHQIIDARQKPGRPSGNKTGPVR